MPTLWWCYELNEIAQEKGFGLGLLGLGCAGEPLGELVNKHSWLKVLREA